MAIEYKIEYWSDPQKKWLFWSTLPSLESVLKLLKRLQETLPETKFRVIEREIHERVLEN